MSSSSSVKRVSECFIKPLHDQSPESKRPIHFTPFELPGLNSNYSQKGLLFAKPENQHFSINTFLDKLQQSLSAAITHFYPLAGRLATRKQENPHLYVIYLDPENSPGVKFIYAKTDAMVSDIVNPSDTDVPSLVHSFFDLNKAINYDGHILPLLSIQVTELMDGLFIGGSVNHLVADGTSFWHFMATWSEIFRAKEQYHGSISRPPVFNRSDSFVNLPYSNHDEFIERFEVPMFKERFFHFSSTAVSKLKAKANLELKTYKISSLQAVIAVLWRCITRVRGQPHDSQTSCSLMICNRRRLNPPLSDVYFGNPVHVVKGTATVGDLMENGLGWAAILLHEAVVNHDDKAVKERVESWNKNPVIYKISQMLDNLNFVHVGSSPRFNMYGCEFDLGRAIAARSGRANKSDGKITLYPGREGGGSMDVEVCLLPEYMMNIENDQEFVSAINMN